MKDDNSQQPTAIVTGASSGIGFGLTQALLAPGYRVVANSRTMAMEYAGDGIRFNTVPPGVVNTPMHANDDHESLKKLHPIKRLAEISEIVDAVLYLTSATFVTGEVLHVDGGAHAGKW
jgi:NAD(P)-dependent dehydrogenase (short-subunit alcohol dehydrogenase family)